MKWIRCSIGSSFLNAKNGKYKKYLGCIYDKYIKRKYPENKYQYVKINYGDEIETYIIFRKNQARLNEYVYDPNHLQPLTPVDTQERYEIYINTFEKIYENDNYLNIGISGIYGSGKSSLIKAIKTKSFIGNHFSISLADFRNEGILKQDLPKSRLDMIEIKMLRQLYYQSKFEYTKVLRTTNWQEMTKFDVIKRMFLITVIVILILLYIYLWQYIIPSYHGLSTMKLPFILLNALSSYFYKYQGIMIILLTILGGTYFWYLLRKYYLKIRFGIKADKINIEMESAKDDISAISEGKYLHELMYLLKYNCIDTVFIEDLDRFNNTDILAGLKEINFLINSFNTIRHFFPISHLRKNIFHIPIRRRKIRFIYAVRDDVFTDSDRLKFFDIIVPIIPITNTSNSYQRLISGLVQGIPDDVMERLDKYMVKEICSNIWDMRIINEITNEFIVFLFEKLQNQNCLDIKVNTVFCLIVLKVKFPLEYKKLSQNSGICYKRIRAKAVGEDHHALGKAYVFKTDAERREDAEELNDLLSLFLDNEYLEPSYLEYMTYARFDTLDSEDQQFYKAVSSFGEEDEPDVNLKLTYSFNNIENFIGFIKEADIKSSYLWNPELIVQLKEDIDKGIDKDRTKALLDYILHNMLNDIPLLGSNWIPYFRLRMDEQMMYFVFERLIELDTSKKIFIMIINSDIVHDDYSFSRTTRVRLIDYFLTVFERKMLDHYDEAEKEKLRTIFSNSWELLFPEIVASSKDILIELTELLHIQYVIPSFPTETQEGLEYITYIIEHAHYDVTMANAKRILSYILQDNENTKHYSVISNCQQNSNNAIIQRLYKLIEANVDAYIETCKNNEELDEPYVIWLLESYKSGTDGYLEKVLKEYSSKHDIFSMNISDTNIYVSRCLMCMKQNLFSSTISNYLDLYGVQHNDYISQAEMDSAVAECINEISILGENITCSASLLLNNNEINYKNYEIIAKAQLRYGEQFSVLNTKLDEEKLELLVRLKLLNFDTKALDILSKNKRLLCLFIMLSLREIKEQELDIINDLKDNKNIKDLYNRLAYRLNEPKLEFSMDKIEVLENDDKKIK